MFKLCSLCYSAEHGGGGGSAQGTPLFFVLGSHRIRINTEGKAKIGAAVWGTEFIQFHATLANLQQDD